jgi:hypothetical protein
MNIADDEPVRFPLGSCLLVAGTYFVWLRLVFGGDDFEFPGSLLIFPFLLWSFYIFGMVPWAIRHHVARSRAYRFLFYASLAFYPLLLLYAVMSVFF